MRLPTELVKNICEYADLRCYLCKTQLYPWVMIGYGNDMLICLHECYLGCK